MHEPTTPNLLLNSQRLHGIDPSSAASRKKASKQCNCEQNDQRQAEGGRIPRTYFVKQIAHQTGEEKRCYTADRNARNR